MKPVKPTVADDLLEHEFFLDGPEALGPCRLWLTGHKGAAIRCLVLLDTLRLTGAQLPGYVATELLAGLWRELLDQAIEQFVQLG
jgi:hypothetical protein